jgi:deoxyadenosine/deoxycytidine kinase
VRLKLKHLVRLASMTWAVEGNLACGKCFATNTLLLMADGSSKMVQDIAVGDLLLGDDSTPRRVLCTTRGYGALYDVTPIRGDGTYTVTGQHILCMKVSACASIRRKANRPGWTLFWFDTAAMKEASKAFPDLDQAQTAMDNLPAPGVVEITVSDYIALPSHVKKMILKGYRVQADFAEKATPIDPYFLGLWLGDGTSDNTSITTNDEEIVRYLYQFAACQGLHVTYGGKLTYGIRNRMGCPNPIREALRTAGVWQNKHIPLQYRANSRPVRLAVLAGLIDSDGHAQKGSYDIIQKRKQLAEDIVWLARSLGFHSSVTRCQKSCIYKGQIRTGTYYRVYIGGAQLGQVPVMLPYKRITTPNSSTDSLKYGLHVKSVGDGQYYGFETDGNHRFLLQDFSVTHNSTLLHSLQMLGHTVQQEPVEDWAPFLKRYYTDKSHAFALQTKVLVDMTAPSDCSVTERCAWLQPLTFIHLLHIQGDLTAAEAVVLNELCRRLAIKPDKIIYLRCTPESSMLRMTKRNRQCESGITLDYLQRLHYVYEKAMQEVQSMGVEVITIDVTHMPPAEVLNAVVSLISRGDGT